jgi:DNA-binding Xre family transcriptional regulator
MSTSILRKPRSISELPQYLQLRPVYAIDSPAVGVIPTDEMRRSVQERIRRRIAARLDEVGMTQRELALQVKGEIADSWISGILSGSQGLHWKDFDAVCHALSVSPSELVRYDDSTMREVTPSEMRWLRHFQQLPRDIQVNFLAVFDHFAATVPDQATAILLARLRQVPRSLRAPTIDFLLGQIEAEPTQTVAPAADAPETVAGSTEPRTTRHGQMRRMIGGPRGAKEEPEP